MNHKKTLRERIHDKILFESRKLEPYLSDKLYLQIRFWLRVGYWPNLTHPKSFNEKLNWLKLHDKHPEYTQMVDKVAVKDYVSSIIGEEHIIPTIGIWDSVNDIDWDLLPNQFVLKNTGDSGGIVICRDKRTLDIDAAKAKLRKRVDTNYCKYNKEYPYKDVKNRIIAEAYMEDESGELRDYKFYCFNGEPRFLKVDFGRFTKHCVNYYDLSWRLLPYYIDNYPRDENVKISQPSNLNDMIKLARTLSKYKTFVRVDFYNVNETIYFGELTFFPASGMGKFFIKGWDYELGEYLELP